MTGIKKTTEKNLMLFCGRAHPQLAEEVTQILGTELVPTPGLRVRQLRDLRALRGVGPRLRRVRAAEPHRADQRVDHGAPDHGRRAQARLGEADHGGDAVLRLRAPGQEAPRPRADLGPADGRPVQDRRRRPADRGRPARRPDPGLLRRPGRPPDGAADPGRLRQGEVRRPAAGRGLAGRRPDQGRRALVGPPRRRTPGLHPQDPRHRPPQRDRRQPGRRRRQGPDLRAGRRHDRHRRHHREGGGGADEGRRRGRDHRRDPRDPLRPRRRPAQELTGLRDRRHQHAAAGPGVRVRQAHRASRSPRWSPARSARSSRTARSPRCSTGMPDLMAIAAPRGRETGPARPRREARLGSRPRCGSPYSLVVASSLEATRPLPVVSDPGGG